MAPWVRQAEGVLPLPWCHASQQILAFFSIYYLLLIAPFPVAEIVDFGPLMSQQEKKNCRAVCAHSLQELFVALLVWTRMSLCSSFRRIGRGEVIFDRRSRSGRAENLSILISREES